MGIRTVWRASPVRRRVTLLARWIKWPSSMARGLCYANARRPTNRGPGVDLDESEAVTYSCENTVTSWTQTPLMDGSLQTP